MLPFLNLSIDALARTIDAALPHRWRRDRRFDATKKRKVDGTLAATRLGSTATERGCNERFRQTMLLVREFRMEWPNKTLLTSDDVESILPVSLSETLTSPRAPAWPRQGFFSKRRQFFYRQIFYNGVGKFCQFSPPESLECRQILKNC